MIKPIILLALPIFVGLSGAALAAQDNAGSDWSGNYSFPSAPAAVVRLQQADLIEKMDHDYYDGLGKTIIHGDAISNTTYNIQGDYEDNSSLTTAIGAYNDSTTEIHIDGDGNAVAVENEAESEGNQDASINISAGNDLNMTDNEIQNDISVGGDVNIDEVY